MSETTPTPQRLQTQDTWVNPTTGVGGSDDKAAGFVFVPGGDRLWSTILLGELYEVDDIAARIVDALPEAAFERGWRLESNLDAAAAEKVLDSLDYFKLQLQMTRGRKWSRLYGGAALYIGSDDGPQDTPLQYGGRIHFLQAFERDELQPSHYYNDPLAQKYGDPSHYRLTPIRNVSSGSMITIHESRLIILHGVDTTPRKRAQNQGWGSSSLIRPMKAIQQFYSAYAIVLSLLGDANQNVYKWKGLADLLLAGKEEIIEARMRLMDRVRSTVKGIAVDADEEDFVRSQINVSGIDAVLDKYANRIASAAKMPATVLHGSSPAGMNATGESDLRNWGSQAETERRNVLTPGMEKFIRVLFRASNGPTGGVEPETWSIKWPSLWSPTPREEAEIRSINAQTDQTYVDMQVLKPADVAKARFSGDTEQQQPMLSPDDIAALEGAQVPPPPVDGAGEPASGAGEPASGATASTPGAEVDTDDAGEDTPIDETVTALAAKMTAHGVRWCEHNMANICDRCGIERVRDFEPGPDGQPVWKKIWRPIGTGGAALPAEPESAEPPSDA